MLLLLRKLLFYFLAVLYLIAMPYAVLYGLGYIYNPVEGEIQKTGLVSVVTEPKNAAVYIGGKRFSQKTPTAVRDLLPGRYQIRLSGKKIDAWEKIIEISPEKATRLEPVILLAKNPDIETVSYRAYADLLPRDSEFKIFALQGENLKDLWKVDLFFKRDIPLGEKIDPSGETKILDIFSKKDSDLVIFKTARGGKVGFAAYDTGREKETEDLSAWIPASADWIEWDPKNTRQIYFLSRGQLGGADLQKKQAHAPRPDILGVGAKHNRLYLLKNDFSLQQSGMKNETPEPILEKYPLNAEIFQRTPARFYQVELLRRDLFQQNLLVLRSDQGALIGNWPPYKLVDYGVLGFQYATKGDEEKILFWTKTEIGILEFSENNEDEGKTSSKTIFYSKGEDIRQAFWAYDDTHVVFLDGEKIFLLEAGEIAPYLARPLGEAAPHSHILYNDRARAVYYLDTQTRHLMKRKITD